MELRKYNLEMRQATTVSGDEDGFEGARICPSYGLQDHKLRLELTRKWRAFPESHLYSVSISVQESIHGLAHCCEVVIYIVDSRTMPVNPLHTAQADKGQNPDHSRWTL